MFQKKKKSIVFFNNRDIVSFVKNYYGQSCYGDSKRGQQRGGGEKTAPLNKLNNKYLNISLSFSFSFDFVFNYQIFARADIATNQIRIHVTLKICNTRSNLVFRYSCKLGTYTDIS